MNKLEKIVCRPEKTHIKMDKVKKSFRYSEVKCSRPRESVRYLEVSVKGGFTVYDLP